MAKNGWHMRAHTEIHTRLDRIENKVEKIQVDLVRIIERDRIKTIIFGTIGGGAVSVVLALIKIFF
jgi:tetrahydromethanopterin S-methyltransferase subunit G